MPRKIKCPHCGNLFSLPSGKGDPQFSSVSRLGLSPRRKILRVGDLVLNPNAFEVLRAGAKIVLSLTLFRLLESLMRHSGSVVPRNVLAHSVWNSNADVAHNLIDVSISQLRKKVDRHHDVKLIKTIRNVGYIIWDPTKSS